MRKGLQGKSETLSEKQNRKRGEWVIRMDEKYIISIDQSTQGTKAILFDENGELLRREDMGHRQIVSEQGFVSHDPEEIYRNVIRVVNRLLNHSGIDRRRVCGVGISNQRETTLVWDRATGKPAADAIVWQCSRAAKIAEAHERMGHGEKILKKTGLKLSPYFPASKLEWMMQNIDGLRMRESRNELCMGTIDAWLVYRLTGGKSYKTDYSNASRTQLFNIRELKWDEELCELFGIHIENLPEVCDSDSCYGWTDFEGALEQPVPIHSVLGDSHAALFGQGCLMPGMIKATYGTGSSVMMNVGDRPVSGKSGIVSSLAWKMQGQVKYVLEGNINYTGAVVSWLKNEMRMISEPGETEALCREAEQDDGLYLVPAFTGLGAPYWNSRTKGILCGITRTTGREEVVRAGVESIAYQIRDIVDAMAQDLRHSNGSAEAGLDSALELRVDGGPTKNEYLMQFQSDILGKEVSVSQTEEMSGIGAACAAGIALGIYDRDILNHLKRKHFYTQMDPELRDKKYSGWKKAVGMIL